MKASCKKLKSWAKEEHSSSREYRKYNLPGIAKQESHHAKIIERKIKREC